METRMNETSWQGTEGTMCTAGTVFLFIIARFTLSDLAAVATIIAALSTVALNAYRGYSLKKKQENDRTIEKDHQE